MTAPINPADQGQGAFTPGPWARDGDGRTIWAGGDYICDIKLDEDDPDVIANAHLIAAAPELYEALSDARTAVARLVDDSNYRTELLAKYDAALAKARGQ